MTRLHAMILSAGFMSTVAVLPFSFSTAVYGETLDHHAKRSSSTYHLMGHKSAIGSGNARAPHEQSAARSNRSDGTPEGYGRGFEGYDGRPAVGSGYGVAAAAALPDDGLDDPGDPGYGYGIGLPAYVYPLTTFWPHELYERGSLGGMSVVANTGGGCATPTRSCRLQTPSDIGLGCSCKKGNERMRGLVTR